MKQKLLMMMKIHSLSDVLTFAFLGENDTKKKLLLLVGWHGSWSQTMGTTYIAGLDLMTQMKKRYGIMDVILPCDLLWNTLMVKEYSIIVED